MISHSTELSKDILLKASKQENIVTGYNWLNQKCISVIHQLRHPLVYLHFAGMYEQKLYFIFMKAFDLNCLSEFEAIGPLIHSTE